MIRRGYIVDIQEQKVSHHGVTRDKVFEKVDAPQRDKCAPCGYSTKVQEIHPND